jgi:hypothetical protein
VEQLRWTFHVEQPDPLDGDTQNNNLFKINKLHQFGCRRRHRKNVSLWVEDQLWITPPAQLLASALSQSTARVVTFSVWTMAGFS